MIRGTMALDDSEVEPVQAGAGVSSFERMTRELAHEFAAPVGVFDPRARCWCAISGAGCSQFPPIDERLAKKTSSSELGLGQVVVWRDPEDRRLLWLLLPLSGADVDGEVALVGFRALSPQPGTSSPHQIDEPDHQRGCVNWGPVCPEPALRAWGQQVANRMREEQEARTDLSSSTKSSDQEASGVVIGRLTRRLRISDPPHHFQTVATTVLRTSLKMAAVAWIPKDQEDKVVVSGEIGGLSSQALRAIPLPGGRESTLICADGDADYPSGAPQSVRRYASVAAGALGWLVAVNPLEDRAIRPADIERLQYVGSLIVAQLSNARIYADLKELLFGIIQTLTAAIDAKDPYTSGHSERVARIAVRLAEELEMPAPKRSDLYLAGLLHDVGKIGVDDVLLKKSGALTPEEYRKIQAHVEIGVTILKDLKKLHHILPGVRHHHESMDGTGYPDHLRGEEIPLEARILAVADSFDAMSSNRPYRARLSLGQIDAILRRGRDVQWDPAVIDALFSCRSDLELIRQKGLGESLIGAVDVTLGRK
jgi:HD-GYP domain-containing protein (c-di-GMP phosphodiesterase class II)